MGIRPNGEKCLNSPFRLNGRSTPGPVEGRRFSQRVSIPLSDLTEGQHHIDGKIVVMVTGLNSPFRLNGRSTGETPSEAKSAESFVSIPLSDLTEGQHTPSHSRGFRGGLSLNSPFRLNGRSTDPEDYPGTVA